MHDRLQDSLAGWIRAVKYQYSDEFVGPHDQQIVIVLDSCSMFEMGRRGKSGTVGDMINMVIIDIPTPEVSWCDYRRPPLPKPSKQKLHIKEPKQQSFRRVMRSVNRNR